MGVSDPPAVQLLVRRFAAAVTFSWQPLVAVFLPTVLRRALDVLVFADLVEDFLAVFLAVFFDVVLAFAALALVALALVALALVASGFRSSGFRRSGYCLRCFLHRPWKSPSHRFFCFFCSRFNSRLGEGSGGLSR